MRAILILSFSMLLMTAAAQRFWLTTNEFPGGPKTAITIADDSALFVGLQSGIIRSFDNGNSFDTTLQASAIFSLYTTSSGRVFAGGSGKIFNSDDLGQSWDSVLLSTTYPVVQILENLQGQLFAISGVLDVNLGFVGEGILFSDDGVTWTPRNNGLGIYTSCQHVAIDRIGRLYLAAADEYVTGNSGLFVSDDKGLNWRHVSTYVDGQGVIENKLNVESVFSLKVTPEDSVMLSFTGVSRDGGAGVAVVLNLLKSIHDIDSSNFWTPRKVFNSISWWLDRKLNNIHFAENGDWYSSTNGTTNSGGTYFSTDNGIHWKFIDDGLGVDIFGGRNVQFFAETPSGKVFMVQRLDERIYWADTSMLSVNTSELQRTATLRVFPNPVRRCGQITLNARDYPGSFAAEIFDISARRINSIVKEDEPSSIEAPVRPGLYFLHIKYGQESVAEKLLVY